MATIVWCIYSGKDDAVSEAAVTMSFLIIGSTVGAYVFGATWQDVKQ